MVFHWFLPTNGDGRHVSNVVSSAGVARGALTRGATVPYLAQVARAAEQVGFDAALTPTGAACEDAWVTTAMLTQHTNRLRFLVAFRPGFVLPTLAAQQAASFQRLSGGRLALNIVTGGDPLEQRSYGDRLDHDERYARTGEFLHVLRGLWDTAPFDFDGDHFHVEGAGFPALPSRRPPVYFGGASPAAERVAARYADVYLAWGEPIDALVQRRARVAALAAEQGRLLRYGVRLHVISRDTADEAWDEADRLLAGMDARGREEAQRRFSRMESVGQSRMTALTAGFRDPGFQGPGSEAPGSEAPGSEAPGSEEPSVDGTGARGQLAGPNLWAGIGLLREGAGTALVGSHDEVAQRLDDLADAGFDEFILSGWPHLEEAYRVGEDVLPRTRAGSRLAGAL